MMNVKYQLRPFEYRIIVWWMKTTVANEILFLDHERQQQDYRCSIDYIKSKQEKEDEDIKDSNESSTSIPQCSPSLVWPKTGCWWEMKVFDPLQGRIHALT
jgi:hypothetical protein